MMEQSTAMQESLKKVEEQVAKAAEAPKASPDAAGGAGELPPLNGWDAVRHYFKGE